MAWTAPRTWVAGETVTAALMNTHVRDNLKSIGDPWLTHVPTLTGMTLGTGTLTCRYMIAGKLINLALFIQAGGTTAYTAAVNFTLPVTAIGGREQVGVLKLFTGAADFGGVVTVGSGASTMVPRVPTSAANGTLLNLSNTSPNTGTAGNLGLQLTYETA